MAFLFDNFHCKGVEKNRICVKIFLVCCFKALMRLGDKTPENSKRISVFERTGTNDTKDQVGG